MVKLNIVNNSGNKIKSLRVKLAFKRDRTIKNIEEGGTATINIPDGYKIHGIKIKYDRKFKLDKSWNANFVMKTTNLSGININVQYMQMFVAFAVNK